VGPAHAIAPNEVVVTNPNLELKLYDRSGEKPLDYAGVRFFLAVRPLIKLADGTFLIGDHADASDTTFLESEFAFAGLRWMKLDIDRVVTVGRYGPVGEASNWADPPDLGKVDEVGFVDLIPGSGHGSGGYVNVASFEVYGTPVKRGGGR
jgi:hypothetical protein